MLGRAYHVQHIWILLSIEEQPPCTFCRKRATPRPGRAGSHAQTIPPAREQLQRTLLATIWERDLRAKFGRQGGEPGRDLGRLGLPRGKCWFAYYGWGVVAGLVRLGTPSCDWTLKIGPMPNA